MEELSELLLQRRRKVDALWEAGINPYPNDFKPHHTSADFRETYGTVDTIEDDPRSFTVAGRIIARRSFGKAAFIQIQDRKGRMQVYVRKDTVGDDAFDAFETFDIGDIVGVGGTPFRTKTGELTLNATFIRLLTKSLQPLPEKFHGLTDVETRYRQRYVDLIVNPEVREVFVKRSRIVNLIREFMVRKDFLEVETPMMQPIPGGATARPFVTHHNALDMQLFLRIAPELYLKRLVVGGFERVFEINRNFRNEGIDSSHSPEFAMLEYYDAYGTYDDSARTVQEVIQEIAVAVFGSTTVTLADGTEYDFGGEWKQLEMYPSLNEALARKFPGQPEVTVDSTVDELKAIADVIGLDVPAKGGWGHGKLVEEIWELLCEDQLDGPVFVRDFPVETSPLTRQHRSKPGVTEKWDLYVRGFELATGYSELVDPVIQRERFEDQARLAAGGDDEAMVLDEDFLHAMEQGMPPTTGVGMGVDRLLMAFTGLGIRETVLFPIVKPEQN